MVDTCSEGKKEEPPYGFANPVRPPGPVPPERGPNPGPNPSPGPDKPKSICALCNFDFSSEYNEQVVSGVTADADLTVDPGADPIRSVPGAIFGGNDIYTWNSFYLRDREILKKHLPKGFTIRWHLWNDSSDGRRWDDGSIEPEGGAYGYNLLNAEEYRSFTENGGDVARLDQWKGSGSWIGNHSMELKFSGEGEAYSTVAADEFADPGEKKLPIYGRIDINPGSGLDIKDTLEVLRFNFSDGIARVVLTGDKHLALLSESGSVLVESGGPVDVGKWASVEAGFTGSGAKLYVDGVEVGQADAGIHGSLNSYQVGHRLLNEQINGSLYIDEGRINDKYMGGNVPSPVETVFNSSGTAEPNVIDYFTFEGNQQTIDDRMQLVEGLGAQLVLQLPVSYDSDYPIDPSADAENSAAPDAGAGFAWDTNIYWADLIEYITGKADASYTSQAPPIGVDGKFKHDIAPGGPGHYNWADLRARRGRVAPYQLKRVEIGNEPYYTDWSDDLTRFAQKWADEAHMIHTANPGVDLGLPVNSGIDKDVFAGVVARRQAKYPGEALIGWVAIHEYSKLLLAADESQVPWWVGGWPVAVNWPGEPWENGPFEQLQTVKKDMSNYLSGEPGYEDIGIGLTEFGFGIANFFQKRYNFMGDAMMRATYVGAALDNGIDHAQTWGFLNDQGFAYGLIGQGPEYSAGGGLPLFAARLTGRQFAPSFHLYKMYRHLLGDELLPVVIDGPTYPVDDLMTHWETPYISAQATRDTQTGELTLIFVNRDLANGRVIDINVLDSQYDKVQVAELTSDDPYDSNEEDPGKVSPAAYNFKIGTPTFKFRLKPLSITFLRFKSP